MSTERSLPVGGIRLRIITPSGIAVDTDVSQVTAESPDGSFTMLPRHIDMVAPLTQGLVEFVVVEPHGTKATGVVHEVEHVVAVDRGTLVKFGDQIHIATADAIRGDDIIELRRELRHTFAELDERERRSRSVLTRLESDVTRRLMELDADAR